MTTTEATVLVVTCLTDVTSDLVIDALNRRGARVVRVNPTDILTGDVEFSATIGDSTGWRAVMATSTRRVDLEEVTAVYYRRPSRWRSEHSDTQTREFVQAEARHGFGGLLYNLPHTRYVNHPAAVSRAEYKPGQLQTAVHLGLTVPPTLITNIPEAAQKFAKENAPVVYKSMRGLPPSDDGVAGAIWAQRVDPATIDDSISATAHMLQAEVAKTSDVRATVVEDTVFASAITTRSGELDWRQARWDDLHCQPVTVPLPVTQKLRAYLDAYDLVFGCFDFCVIGTGELPDDWWHLECNPNGQWGFLDNFADIADAFARALTTPESRS